MLAVVWVCAVPTSQYPHLCYPEMYVLKGGYKSLVSSHPHLCRPGPASSGEPRSRYTKMLDPMWSEQYQRAQADYLQAWKRLTKRDKGCVHTPTPPRVGRILRLRERVVSGGWCWSCLQTEVSVGLRPSSGGLQPSVRLR